MTKKEYTYNIGDDYIINSSWLHYRESQQYIDRVKSGDINIITDKVFFIQTSESLENDLLSNDFISLGETRDGELNIVTPFSDNINKPFLFNDGYNLKREIVSIEKYIHFHKLKYNGDAPRFISEVKLPPSTAIENLTREALNLQTSDITIMETNEGILCYHRTPYKIKHESSLSKFIETEKLIRMIAPKASIGARNNKPIYCDYRMDSYSLNLRIVINKSVDGDVLTIRLLPDKSPYYSLEDCKYNRDFLDFVHRKIEERSPGLFLVAGPTNSGKNTLINGILKGMPKDLKIVSVEQPVEIFNKDIIQMNTADEEEFTAVVNSLIRQNPDICYISELTDRTASEALKIANTGKLVFATIHSNDIISTVDRLLDLSNTEREKWDKVLLYLNTIVHQQLVVDETKGRIPKVSYLDVTELHKDLISSSSLREAIGFMRREVKGLC